MMKNLHLRSKGTFLVMYGLSVLAVISACDQDKSDFPINPDRLTVVEVLSDSGPLEEGKEGVKADAVFSVVFSNPVDRNLARASTSLSNSGGAVMTNITFNENGSIMAVTPADSLAFETVYVLAVQPGMLGEKGETLDPGLERSFTTEIEPNSNIFESGSGTASDPFVIVNGEQMNSVRLFLESYFVLGDDVDLSQISNIDPMGWEPIGVLGEEFVGSFDGKDHTISGLFIDRPAQTEVGLFGVLGAPGKIMNLRVSVTGVNGEQATGALVGRQLDGLISNCHTAGSVTCTSSRAGGLVGSQEAGLIDKCSSSCGISSTLSRAGGLVGLTQAGTITQSHASGNCASMSSRAGGLVGSVEADAVVEDSYSTGNTTGANRVGSVFGRLDGVAMRCYGTGSITVTDADDSNDYPGNVVGELGGTSTLTDAYYPEDQTINYGGGSDITREGTPTDIATFSCSDPSAVFTNFDFENTWSCTSDGLWPKLKWE